MFRTAAHFLMKSRARGQLVRHSHTRRIAMDRPPTGRVMKVEMLLSQMSVIASGWGDTADSLTEWPLVVFGICRWLWGSKIQLNGCENPSTCKCYSPDHKRSRMVDPSRREKDGRGARSVVGPHLSTSPLLLIFERPTVPIGRSPHGTA